MTFAICAGVFIGCFVLSWKLGQFIKDCDERQEMLVTDAKGYAVIKEAERIAQEAAKR